MSAPTRVDQTGRLLRAGQRDAIPREWPILARLDPWDEDGLTTMCGWRQLGGTAFGGATAWLPEAARRDCAGSRTLPQLSARADVAASARVMRYQWVQLAGRSTWVLERLLLGLLRLT